MDSEQPPGFRFQPSEEELINFLNLKKQGSDDQVSAVIGVLDICNFEPWELPERSATQSNDYTWYFFSLRDYKYKNSKRVNRRTEAGYWKVTGKERKIVSGNNNDIGAKKNLVFYEGNVPNGAKTNWVIHEFHSNMNCSDQRDFVLCRLKQKPDGSKYDSIYGEGHPSLYVTQQTETQVQGNMGNSPTAFDEDFSLSFAQQLEMCMWQEAPPSY